MPPRPLQLDKHSQYETCIFRGVLQEIGQFSSTQKAITKRKRSCLITRMPLTWPFSYTPLATASCEGEKTPSEGLPLMKTARFLAGWSVFSAMRPERGAQGQGLAPQEQAKRAKDRSPSPWARQRAPRAVPQRSEDCLSTGYAAAIRGATAG